MSLEKQKVLVVGGSSGIGLAIARAAFEAGATVLIAGRSQQKLAQAQQEINAAVQTYTIDTTKEDVIKSSAQSIGEVNHLVITASETQGGAFYSGSTEVAKAAMESKFWGAYLTAKSIKVTAPGSITFFSGIYSQRPPVGYSATSATNAALEGLGRALAVELSPIRVNVISPGIINTPIYGGMPEQEKQAFFQSIAEKLPVKRIGQPEDIAQATLSLLQNSFITGTVFTVDGGSLIV